MQWWREASPQVTRDGLLQASPGIYLASGRREEAGTPHDLSLTLSLQYIYLKLPIVSYSICKISSELLCNPLTIEL